MGIRFDENRTFQIWPNLGDREPRLKFPAPPFRPRLAVAQTKGDLVSLEHIKKPGFKIKVNTKPGALPEPVLTSPRSVHVCMEAGVDPFTLLEKPLEAVGLQIKVPGAWLVGSHDRNGEEHPVHLHGAHLHGRH